MSRTALLLAVAAAPCAVESILVAQGSSGCAAEESARSSKVLAKMAMFDVECEEMCKRLGVYPDGCQCPGFTGNPSSDGDVRKCIDQYCQDPKTPCPNDGFVTCVDESTKIAALQWNIVAGKVEASLAGFSKMLKASKGTGNAAGNAAGAADACAQQELKSRSLLQQKLAMMDVQCEEMCKKLGAYPDGCQCPGFAGNPSSAGDVRKCIDQYCQDPKTPCPTEGFVTCVDETTKISALQWSSVLAKFDSTVSAIKNTVMSGTNSSVVDSLLKIG